jgi:hypothetical protein
MGLWPTHRHESAFLRFIDSKRVMRDFRRSVKQNSTERSTRMNIKLYYENPDRGASVVVNARNSVHVLTPMQ